MRKIVYILVLLTCISNVGLSQGFTNINAGLTGLHWSDVAWGDYDADGDLDVIIAGLDANGAGKTKIYKNNGSGMFTEVLGLNLPGVFVGDLCWGDYDNDGDLDLLLQGYTDSNQFTRLYKNEGGDNFTNSGISFPPLADGSVSFVDYNNDAYQDILVAGYDGVNYKSVLYKNNGNATFTDSGITFPGCIKSSYVWGDYDNDGDMDLFISGMDMNGALISKLYNNGGNESFSETFNSFTGAWLGDVAWGDYDNDGDLDLLLSGYTLSTERVAKIYRNNGAGGFSELLFTGLVGVSHSSTIWGDYDNDGDLDIFIGGTYEGNDGWVRVTDVFLNNGDNSFSAAGFSFSADVYWGESAWGDYDNDGDLDLICCGFDDLGGSNTIIYRNDVSVANTAPNPPESIDIVVTDNEIEISWAAGSDNETADEGLSYNAYIKNEDGDIIWNSLSNTDDGFRLIPDLGNSQQNNSWTIKNLAVGNYTCAVQSIDHNWAGSIFSEEETFVITYVGLNENTATDDIILSNYPNPFTGSTTISYSLKTSAYIQIDIFDTKGQLITHLLNEKKEAGEYTVIWDVQTSEKNRLDAGVYYYVLKENGVVLSQKPCLLIK